MIMASSPKQASLPKKYRAGFLTSLDGRTELSRALRERYDSIATDLGGIEELSAIKSSLLERFVWLEATLSNLEAELCKIDDPKSASETLSRWIQGCNSLLGIAKTLGIERQMQRAPWMTAQTLGG